MENYQLINQIEQFLFFNNASLGHHSDFPHEVCLVERLIFPEFL
jgi:hypothetical protein